MLWTALVLGFLGSFHCIGMCGPIALAVGGNKGQTFLWNKIIYNLGRSLTYAFLGLIIGSLGFSLSLAGVQQGISITMGVLVVLLSVSYKKADRFLTIPALSGVVTWVKSHLARNLKSGSKLAFFATGIVNGLLPCGMVYMALVVAMGMQSPLLGATYMFFFGIGTIPMLLGLMVSGSLLPAIRRQQFQKAIPYLGILIGVLMVFRGLGLGIPGFSPELATFDYGAQQVEITMCH
ncbi:sulfite exporter TauE/SafE family protein [Algoriphagus sp.]|uniref:sulfite exporter TauE/SafE family protein n=1 Tax=Algoriphagus sp. TaxID=1872435 RepID=UPI0027162D33|nr:sulfite exporter TauE/SafE family protein [Algoriphagus sp.]MDO8968642.1 sulfite exporter TauE/SafE family protein [Algoriphagus sp.]MDP3200336.1 sulfite exporter TauE/SafE family protein [Algoriphagus sp.]